MLARYSPIAYSGLYGAYGGMSDADTIKVAKAWWNTDWSKRNYHPEALLGAAETMLTLANGARPTFVTAPDEYRATIKGGLMALARVGIQPWAGKADAIDALPTKMTPAQKNADDDQLTAIVGLSGHKASDLKAAAIKVRGLVQKAGLEAQAWGLRGLLLLQQEAILEATHGAVVSVLAMIPPAWIAAAIGGAHLAAEKITSSVLKAKFTKFVSVGEADFAKKAGEAIQKQADKDQAAAKKDLAAQQKAFAAMQTAQKKALAASQKPAQGSTFPTPLLYIGGALLLGGGLLFALKRRSAGAE